MKNIIHVFSTMLIVTLANLLVCSVIYAQVPEKFSYQAVVRDADNKLVVEQDVGMQISILKGSASGIEVYVETQNHQTNANGLVSIEIGDGTVVSGVFSLIDWSDDSYFLQIEIDPNGGTIYSITATSQLLSVPYALHSKTAANAASVKYVDSLIVGVMNQFAHPSEHFITPTTGTVKDIGHNVYKIVKIGNQWWMAENLINRAGIPWIQDPAAWSDLTTAASCFYPPEDIEGLETDLEVIDAYGWLYNWYAVNTENLCPVGWKVPNHHDFMALSNYIGDQGVPANERGNALRTCRQVNSPLGGDCNTTEHPRFDESESHYGTDIFGFSALPGGWRSGSDGSFGLIGSGARFWTSQASGTEHAWMRSISLDVGTFSGATTNKENGYSIRCIRE